MNYINMDEILAVKGSTVRYKFAIDSFLQFKVPLSENIKSILDNKPCPKGYKKAYTKVEIAKATGMGTGHVNHCFKGNRWFAPSALGILAYKFLFCSCDSLFFEREPVAMLSKAASVVAESLLDEAETGNADVCAQYIEEAYEETKSANKLITFSNELINNRIMEYTEDRYIFPDDIVVSVDESEKSNPYLRLTMKKLYNSSEPQSVRLTLLLYLSIMLNAPLDYFIAPDYARYVDVRLFGTTGDNDIIKNEKIKRRVGMFLQLPPEPQSEQDKAEGPTYKSQAEVFSYVVRDGFARRKKTSP